MSTESRPARLLGRLAGPALGALLALAAAVSSGAPLAAQAGGAGGTITGTVRDSTGAGINGAELTVEGGVARAYSDAAGAFRLAGVPTGEVSLRVRRIGFRPAAVAVTVGPGGAARVDVTVIAVAQPLDAVVVRAGQQRYTGPLADFYRRRDSRGPGRFISRAEIDRRNPMRFTDLLRTLPGVQLISTGTIPNAVRFRGQRCAPLVWLDGGKLSAGEFDVDLIDPYTVEGIEIYSSFSTVPPQFMGVRGQGNCGVIVIWSGFSERRRRWRAEREATQQLAAELARMVEALQVFTADQVDTPARPDSSAPVRPTYPDSLYKAGIEGTVVAEFVVDSTGQITPETIGVVSATHPLFADAVRRALPEARFAPAMRGGRRVQQVVQLPFRFVASAPTTQRP